MRARAREQLTTYTFTRLRAIYSTLNTGLITYVIKNNNNHNHNGASKRNHRGRRHSSDGDDTEYIITSRRDPRFRFLMKFEQPKRNREGKEMEKRGVGGREEYLHKFYI